MKKNRIRICGRNTTTAPTPAITPSAISDRSTPSGMVARTALPRFAKPASIASAGTTAQVNTAWNIRNRMAVSRTSPATGCSATASIACVQRRTGVSDMVPATAIARARRWSVTISSATLPSQRAGGAGGAHRVAEVGEDGVERGGGEDRPGEHRMEDKEEGGGKQDQHRDWRQSDGVDRVGPAADRRVGYGSGDRDRARAALERDDIVGDAAVAGGEPHRRAVPDHPGERLFEIVAPAPPHRDGRHHGDAQLARKRFRLKPQPGARRRLYQIGSGSCRASGCTSV